MPDKKGRLNGMEQRFVKLFAETGDATYAAEKAGYTQPSSRGGMLVARPAIMAQVRAYQSTRLVMEGMPVAIDALLEIAGNKTLAPSPRVQAADKLLRHARELTDGTAAREAFEMTAEELATAIRNKLEANTIDVTPKSLDEADPFE